MNQIALAVAVVLLALPASARTWIDEGCEVSLVSQKLEFTFGKVDGSQKKDCTMTSWPLDTPTAQLSCKDGSTSELTFIDDTTVIFDGRRLDVYSGTLPCAPYGEERPDSASLPTT